VTVLLANRYVPETRDEESDGPLDLTGAALAALGLAGLVYALTEGPRRGWSTPFVLCLAAGIALLVAFVVYESRSSHPMMPLSLFRSRDFAGANLVTLVVYAALSGGMFLIPVVLQRVSGFSPVAAGSTLLPVTAVMLLLSARMGRLAQRIGPRWPMTIGPIVGGAGLALLARLPAHATFVANVLPAVLIFALGLSITVAPLTATVLAAAPAHQVGVASAVNNDVARAAGLLAIAVLPSLAGITPHAYDDAGQLLTGFHHAVLIAGALCAFGGVLSAFVIGRAAPDATETACRPAREQDPAALRFHCGVCTPHARP